MEDKDKMTMSTEASDQFDHLELNAEQCEKNKQEGIARAANRSGKAWQALAVYYVEQYPNEEPFRIEHARVWAYKNGMPQPPGGKDVAWGQVPKTCLKLGIIERVGDSNTTNPNCHGCVVGLYVKAKKKVVEKVDHFPNGYDPY